MFFQRFIAFLLMALMPLLALADTSSTATLRSTVYSTEVTYITKTGSPPAGATGTGNVSVTNSTITSVKSPQPTTSETFKGAAAGALRFPSDLAGAAVFIALIGLL